MLSQKELWEQRAELRQRAAKMFDWSRQFYHDDGLENNIELFMLANKLGEKLNETVANLEFLEEAGELPS